MNKRTSSYIELAICEGIPQGNNSKPSLTIAFKQIVSFITLFCAELPLSIGLLPQQKVGVRIVTKQWLGTPYSVQKFLRE
jgi:hypothetical protein